MTLAAVIQFIAVLLILGVVWYLVDKYIPIPPLIRTIITVVVVVCVIVWLLSLVGINVLGGLHLH